MSFIKDMIKSDTDVSSMRVLTIICVLNAILVSWCAIGLVLLGLFNEKFLGFDIMSITMLCGVFLTPLVPKAIQSFGERGRHE